MKPSNARRSEHWLVSGKSARQTAAELGIATQTLQNWQKKFKALPAGAVAGTLEALQAENRRLQKELHRMMQQRDSKKNLGHNLRTVRQRFQRIKAMRSEYPIDQLCATLGVTRSGYHAWPGRRPGSRAQANAALLPLIEAAHQESRQTCGAPRVHRWRRQHGHACGRHRIARLMRAARLQSQTRRRFRPMSLANSNHDLPIAPNRLREVTPPSRRDAVWVADITYVPTDEGWLYVAGVLDRCTRRCIGWAMGETLATTLPLAALAMALAHRQPPAGLAHHSDRGVQYASENYRRRLAQAGVVPRMSRRGKLL
jgi:putative transposase